MLTRDPSALHLHAFMWALSMCPDLIRQLGREIIKSLEIKSQTLEVQALEQERQIEILRTRFLQVAQPQEGQNYSYVRIARSGIQ